MIATDISPEEQAYRDADELTWRGQPLQPFSFLRKTAAMAIVNNNIPEPIALLWVCLQPDEKVRAARRNPAAVEPEIDAWAESESLLQGITVEPEAQALYARIMGAIAAVTPQGDDSEKKSDGAPVNPPTTSRWLPQEVAAHSRAVEMPSFSTASPT